jgi:bla regulator protein blaR1
MKIILKFVFILFPTLLSAQQSETSSVNQLNLDSIFSPKSATFVLFNMNNNSYSVYNESMAKEYYPAHSTIKTLCSIATLEQNIVKETDYVHWDSIKYKRQDWWNFGPYVHWCDSQNIVSALKYSVNWYYVELLKKMDMQQTKILFDNLDFGLIPDTLHPNYFFVSNRIYTNAFKQADFHAGLYQNKLDIKPSTKEIILKSLIIKSEPGYILYIKTGAGEIKNGNMIGWIVGIIEKQGTPYAFALNFEEPNFESLPKLQNELRNKLHRVLLALQLNDN